MIVSYFELMEWPLQNMKNEVKLCCFRPLLYTLFRLNWAKQV